MVTQDKMVEARGESTSSRLLFSISAASVCTSEVLCLPDLCNLSAESRLCVLLMPFKFCYYLIPRTSKKNILRDLKNPIGFLVIRFVGNWRRSYSEWSAFKWIIMAFLHSTRWAQMGSPAKPLIRWERQSVLVRKSSVPCGRKSKIIMA